MILDDIVTPSRRSVLGLGLGALIAGCARGAGGAKDTLFVGDQKAGQEVVLRASHNLDKLPYKIEWSAFPNAAPLLEALNAGAIDTGYGGDAAFIFAIGTGATIKAIGAEIYDGPGPVLVVRGDSPIRSMADIAGKRIATPRGSIGHNLILAALEAQGKPLAAVNFAFLSPQDGQAALMGGSVDGWSIWDPNASIAEQQGARIIPVEDGLVSNYALMFGRDGAIADKRALLTDYKRRLYAGWEWSLANEAVYADLLHRETGIPTDIWRRVNARTKRKPVAITDQLIADQQKTADRYFRAGLLTSKVDVRSGFDKGFT